jgi:hypothetical protein
MIYDELALAREVATQLSERAQRGFVPLRAGFIESPSPLVVPPLASLIRGGRGGEVKVKVLLSILWTATAAPYSVRRGARVWATLLGLPDPDGKGAARVNDALRTLTKENYLRSDRQPGKTAELTLLSELRTGAGYSHPGEAWAAVKGADPKVRRRTQRYLNLPVSLWTSGWIAALNGPGLAMLLILMSSARGRDPENLWFTPQVASDRYALSETTRARGIEELERYGLVSVSRAPVMRDQISPRRFRNTFTLHVEKFDEHPEDALEAAASSVTRPMRMSSKERDALMKAFNLTQPTANTTSDTANGPSEG